MPEVASQDYRDAMACLGASVNIVTTDGRAGRAGFTASAVCSVTDDPPTLLVCMNRGSSAYASVRENGVVCVNVLSARHERLSQLFGSGIPVEQRFVERCGQHWKPVRLFSPTARSLSIAVSLTSLVWVRMTCCFAAWWHCRDRTLRTT